MKLLNQDFSFNYTQFYGKTGTIFTLIGSRGEKINSTIQNTIDTFKTEFGEYIELKRSETMEQVNHGKMLPVLASQIISKNIPAKEYNKYLKA